MILLLALLVSGCARTGGDQTDPEQTSLPAGKDVVYEQLKTPVTTIDPAYVQSDSEVMVAKLIFQGLVKENASGKVVSCIARSWEVSPDGLTYVFHLNKRVLFHNGKEITADDFKFSWERVLRLNAPSAYLFTNIQGANEVLSGNQTLAAGIVAVDKYTLKVTLVHPQDNFINSLTHPAGAVLDRYEVVEQGVKFAKPGTFKQPSLIPSGAGPFKFIEWVDSRSLTLGKNTQYFGTKPAIWRIEFLLNQPTGDAVWDFLAGKTHILQDVTPGDMPPLSGQMGNLSLVEKPVLEVRYVGMNANLEPFTNKAVRDAVSYGLDPAKILKAARGKSGEVLSGYLTDYWYGQSNQESQESVVSHAYEKGLGAEMLELSGHPGGSGLPQITLYCGSAWEDQIVAQKIVENLSSLGFNIKIQALSQKDLRKAVRNGEAAFYTTTFAARSTELDDFFHEQINSRWQKTIENPLWDQLLDNAVQQKGAARLSLYRQLEREVVNDSRIRYLYTYKSAAAVSDRLANFQLGPGNNVVFEELQFKNH
ncbi:hypothetical protein DCMF_02325 [Candidatus Formimonas warabiya]|uniref:Solute-binding protein family 5 domain-containing protein n=2 Tax=Formimonas warabiya TaxID=1761012 RepID=A0A3G1KMS2_FORW1|nr:hypothetical protein DCMF_02325 [Candidatus Formimonas warabiya]